MHKFNEIICPKQAKNDFFFQPTTLSLDFLPPTPRWQSPRPPPKVKSWIRHWKHYFQWPQNIKHSMDMIFIEILQFNCYAVPELPPSRNPLHTCTPCDTRFTQVEHRSQVIFLDLSIHDVSVRTNIILTNFDLWTLILTTPFMVKIVSV